MTLLEDIVTLLLEILLPNKGSRVFQWGVRLCIIVGIAALVWKLS